MDNIWELINLRAKVDEDLILETRQLAGQKFDMVENENYAEAGTLESISGI